MNAFGAFENPLFKPLSTLNSRPISCPYLIAPFGGQRNTNSLFSI